MPSEVDDLFSFEWQHMLPGDRRALALIAYCSEVEQREARGIFVPWSELTTVDRMALVRAMRRVGELATQCADILQRAHDAIERAPIEASRYG